MAAIDLYNRLKQYSRYYSGAAADQHLPAISSRTATLLSILFTLLYVVPFYLSPSTRPSPTLNRDAPSVIRARIQVVTLACIIGSLSTLAIVIYTTPPSPSTTTTTSITSALHLLGYYPITLSSTLPPLLLTLTLFTGPLFEKLIIERPSLSSIPTTLSSWIGYRNFVAGPITEEVLFRSVLLALALLTHPTSPPTKLILLTPLYFAIAHVHHFYEFTLTHPHTPWLPILLRSLFQFSYTTLFGWFASFVYLRTASLYTCVLIHAFCNWAGFPRLWGRLQRSEIFVPAGPYGPPIRTKDDDDDVATPSTRSRSADVPLVWTILYYVLLCAGAYGFYVGLWPLTKSANALVEFGPPAAKKGKGKW